MFSHSHRTEWAYLSGHEIAFRLFRHAIFRKEVLGNEHCHYCPLMFSEGNRVRTSFEGKLYKQNYSVWGPWTVIIHLRSRCNKSVLRLRPNFTITSALVAGYSVLTHEAFVLKTRRGNDGYNYGDQHSTNQQKYDSHRLDKECFVHSHDPTYIPRIFLVGQSVEMFSYGNEGSKRICWMVGDLMSRKKWKEDHQSSFPTQ